MRISLSDGETCRKASFFGKELLREGAGIGYNVGKQGQEETKMNYQQVLENAREKMAPRCRACPECNGIACKGVMPGPGGKGAGRTFQRNFSYLAEHVFLEMDVLQGEKKCDTSIELFGQTFAAPVFVAPIGLVQYNYTSAMTERQYCDAVTLGAKKAGIAAFGGGGLQPEHFYSPLHAIRDAGGWGIPTLKPWTMDVVLQRLRETEECRPLAFAMDIDSAGLPHAGMSALQMQMKTEKDLKEIASAVLHHARHLGLIVLVHRIDLVKPDADKSQKRQYAEDEQCLEHHEENGSDRTEKFQDAFQDLFSSAIFVFLLFHVNTPLSYVISSKAVQTPRRGPAALCGSLIQPFCLL